MVNLKQLTCPKHQHHLTILCLGWLFGSWPFS